MSISGEPRQSQRGAEAEGGEEAVRRRRQTGDARFWEEREPDYEALAIDGRTTGRCTSFLWCVGSGMKSA